MYLQTSKCHVHIDNDSDIKRERYPRVENYANCANDEVQSEKTHCSTRIVLKCINFGNI